MGKRRKQHCPCGSGARYSECCRPYHRGDEPERPAQLVRARFSAFALGDGAYLFATLDAEHPLRSRPASEVERELGQARQSSRYRSVEVREDRVDGADGYALFEARIFSRGRDRSFVELSHFRRAAGWRYLDGLLVPSSHAAATELTIDAFEEALA